ncbi:outer membrane protein assembly factor BamB [Microbulbifer sp. 2304DJ12-6]|uniref:outer membrane protein assembly factor BamB n=1 Tax=Microbulbifer sp. 2304DJ12-6 TaxID=3233340 RepID=UPI002612CD99|nr:outer membrane protein assembly factor BamB [uncultured Microbulbifer sp.]
MGYLKHSVRRAVIAALAFTLGACASNDEKEEVEPLELVEITSSVSLREVWSADVGSIDVKRYAMLQPSLSDDRLVAASSDGEVTAFERSTGTTLWETDLDVELSGGVGAGLGIAVVSDYRGRAVALDLNSGSELWSYQVSGEVVSAPAVGSGVVVLQTVDGKLVGLDAGSGEELWNYNTSLPVLTLRGTAAPVISGGMVIAGLDNGKLIALDARDGIPRWEQRVAIPQGSAELERVVDIDGSPVVRGDLVFAASYQGRVVALSKEGGRGLWARGASTHHAVAVGGGHVFLSGASGSVYAYNVGNGQIDWSNNALLRRELSGPVYFEDVVVVGDLEGYLHLLDPGTGQFIGREQVDGDPIRIPMLVDSDLLFVLSDDGKLVALRLTRG